MGITELQGKYERLRAELDEAYGAPVWHSGRIDRLTEEIAATERLLAGHQHVVPADRLNQAAAR